MQTILDLQKLPTTEQMDVAASTSSVECTGGIIVTSGGNSGCSVQCGG